MHRNLYILFLLTMILDFSNAQSRNGLYSFSLPGKSSIVLTGIGPSYLFGDVGGNKDAKGLFSKTDFNVAQTQYMFSLNYRYIFQNNISIKASTLFGKFNGTDTGTRNDGRGFAFNTNLAVLALHVEYNITGGEFADYDTPHKFYVFGGFGAMISKVNFESAFPFRDNGPYIDSHGSHAVLIPTSTGGYAVKMTTVTPAFPFGLGYEYDISSNISIGFEYVVHASFSDYLDGISTGYSKNRDYLMNLDMILTYKFGSDRANRNRWSF
ncbi:MAG: hypothetical protein AUK44_07895 [Porphyromonadaceae bacterium CG2_30_38_12]|nr:MAG: hypothetical protein AUK44_07895 [Porphyromonadaceae bacterium CG2_30_38_12]